MPKIQKKITFIGKFVIVLHTGFERNTESCSHQGDLL
jgi:hypothetical protein